MTDHHPITIHTRREQELKLRRRASRAEQLLVEINDPCSLSNSERRRLLDNCKYNNLSFYRSARPITDNATVKALAAQLGLYDLCDNPMADADKISRIEVTPDSRYIPYTSRALSWHTDGYYNAIPNILRSFMMHCVQPASQGGTNEYLDHEIAYILLYRKNPDYIKALRQPQAFTIPPNKSIRTACSLPVFRKDPLTGKLLMHYTERSQHIKWHPSCAEARAYLYTLLRTSEYSLSYKLAAGEGVICNNVLHRRSAFDAAGDAPKRLLYRARFRNRVGHSG